MNSNEPNINGLQNSQHQVETASAFRLKYETGVGLSEFDIIRRGWPKRYTDWDKVWYKATKLIIKINQLKILN